MGFSGAPGARQYIDKILKKTQYFTMKVKPEDMNKLRDYAVGEFIDGMAQTDLLDPEDIADVEYGEGTGTQKQDTRQEAKRTGTDALKIDLNTGASGEAAGGTGGLNV